MNITQLEILPRETTAATKHTLINHGQGTPSWKSHRRPDSDENEEHAPENDAPWPFLVDDRAGGGARLRSLVEARKEQAEMKELIAKASIPEYPHDEIRGGQSHELPKC